MDGWLGIRERLLVLGLIWDEFYLIVIVEGKVSINCD